MKKVALIIGLCLMALSSGVFAQDDEKVSPLVNMLSYVPETDDALAGDIQFLNIAAMVAPYEAYSGETPVTPEDKFAMLYNRAYAAGDIFQYVMSDLEGVTTTTGVSPMDIQTVLTFGQPPKRGLVISGGYTVDAVNAAHEARGYFSTTLGDNFTMWCGDDSCDGTKQDIAGRETTNLFDVPPLGRKPPVAVSEGAIISSTDVNLVTTGVAAHDAATGTLAQSPAYGTLANALTQNAPGELIQVYIMPPTMTLQAFPVIPADLPDEALAMLFTRTTPEAIHAFKDEVLSDYATTSPFIIVAFADYFDGENDVTVIALVYTDAESAQTGADEVVKRLRTFNDVITRGPGAPVLIEEIGVTDIKTDVVTDDASGASVARITMTYPQPDASANPRPMTGLLMRALMTATFRRTLYPLWQIQQPE